MHNVRKYHETIGKGEPIDTRLTDTEKEFLRLRYTHDGERKSSLEKVSKLLKMSDHALTLFEIGLMHKIIDACFTTSEIKESEDSLIKNSPLRFHTATP